jgi:hypothetical protein
VSIDKFGTNEIWKLFTDMPEACSEKDAIAEQRHAI